MSDLNITLLRKQCQWQRVQGTKLDNGYPYHKHLPDCDICQAADRLETLEAQNKALFAEREWVSINTFETDSYSYRLQRMKLPPSPQSEQE